MNSLPIVRHSLIAFHKLEIEQGKRIYQLIQSILRLLAQGIVLADEATPLQIFEQICYSTTRLQIQRCYQIRS